MVKRVLDTKGADERDLERVITTYIQDTQSYGAWRTSMVQAHGTRTLPVQHVWMPASIEILTVHR